MAGPYFREWRKKRGFTLEELAERLEFFDDPNLPKTAASLSRLETGKQPYAQGINEALAAIYDIEVAELVGVDPTKRDELDEVLAKLRSKSEFDRARAARLLRALDDSEPPPQPTPEREPDAA